MLTIVCNKCGLEKPVTEYYKEKRNTVKGFRGECKLCTKAMVGRYQDKNRDKINDRVRKYKKCNPEKVKAQKKAERIKNNDRYKQKMKEWQENNQPRIKEYRKRKWAENKEELSRKHVAWGKKRRATDPVYRMIINLRRRTHLALTKGWGGFKTTRYIGCNVEELRSHIEKQFRNGMSWDNYGSEWHVDHIKPLASFCLDKDEERLVAFNYANLQPLWAKENLKKGAKINYVHAD